jgi:hypothetical protein
VVAARPPAGAARDGAPSERTEGRARPRRATVAMRTFPAQRTLRRRRQRRSRRWSRC